MPDPVTSFDEGAILCLAHLMIRKQITRRELGEEEEDDCERTALPQSI